MAKKRNRFLKFVENHLGLSLLSLAILLFGTGVAAQQFGNVSIENVENFVFGGNDSFGATSFVDPATGFNDVTISNDLLVSGDLEVTGTTTQSIIELDSTHSASLTFTAAATTTPGSLFSFQNTSADRICTAVTLDITTGSTSGGANDGGSAFAFSVSTSTAASAYSGSAGSVVASTTAATSTTPLINSVQNPGSYVGDDQDIGGAPWVWANGVYLLGAFDDASLSSGGADYSTSTAAYTSMAGEVHVYCIAR